MSDPAIGISGVLESIDKSLKKYVPREWGVKPHLKVSNLTREHLREPMARWSEGHVTLLGDACHAMLPMLAQGAVMALEDGFILARCFAKYGEDIPTALQRYEAARRERANKVVIGSADNSKRFHNPELASKEGAQAYVDREWSEERTKQRYEWLFTYDVTGVPI